MVNEFDETNEHETLTAQEKKFFFLLDRTVGNQPKDSKVLNSNENPDNSKIYNTAETTFIMAPVLYPNYKTSQGSQKDLKLL